ncbi:putative uncharacterized protein [Moritella viscosa]|nr:hypothetical protein [Moritella viscosa]CED59783.1 putative uncharacterized protein [Moritella viscosa]SHO03224.1 Putative uncharacterized protein [Moritella viscosa]
MQKYIQTRTTEHIKGDVLSTPYQDAFCESLNPAMRNRNFLERYKIFIDITKKNESLPYNGIELFNNKELFNKHVKEFIGFYISDYFDFSRVNRIYYNRSKDLLNFFVRFAKINNLEIDELSFSSVNKGKDHHACVEAFNVLSLNEERLRYYIGWNITSKEGDSRSISLHKFYNHFGYELTDTVFDAINNYARTQKSKTVNGFKFIITSLLDGYCELCVDKADLLHNLRYDNSYHFHEKVLMVLFARHQIEGLDTGGFFKNWGQQVVCFYRVFVEEGVFDEPLAPLIKPQYKKPKTKLSFSAGGKLNQREKEKLLVNIPLHIKDEKVIEIINERVDDNLAFIRKKSLEVFDEIKERIETIKRAKIEGLVRPLEVTSHHPIKVGIENEYNLIATFYEHGVGGKGKNKHYKTYLQVTGEDTNRIFNLPTTRTASALAALLVLEHPSITQSWLEKWELYDKNGKMTGFRQSGDKWVITSVKDRRGSELAQQEVHLTELGKETVELFIKHTSFTRETMKRNGDDGWRYMIISGTVNTTYRKKLPLSPSDYRYLSENEDPNDVEIQNIINLTSPKSIRKASGIKIYLETKSIAAVSQALGHVRASNKTLSHYIPSSLIDFFNDRWIRQYQNAILFESLKDSTCLEDALDISLDEIDEFLSNNKLGKVPDSLVFDWENNSTQENFECNVSELVFTLSTAVLQLLIAIQTIVETATDKDRFIDAVELWYKKAKFVIGTMNLETRLNQDVFPLYQAAIDNPLNCETLKEKLLCR